MSDTDLRQVRRDYVATALSRADLNADPFQQFTHWMEDARSSPLDDVTAMTVATASADGQPSVRTILLKHYDENGFCWYTDQRSPQGDELGENPKAEILFFWREQTRQIRITGTVDKLADSFGDSYFNERPVGSRYAAAASLQTSVIASRAALEAKVEAMETQYPNGDVPRPAGWGGYQLTPQRFEFWQGRESRLHDRFRYTAEGNNWLIERLSP